MEISIVDRFHVRLAEMITGRKDVEALLNRICWLGNFMHEERGANGHDEETVYELRAAMRISMQRRLKRKYSKDRIRALYENCLLYTSDAADEL